MKRHWIYYGIGVVALGLMLQTQELAAQDPPGDFPGGVDQGPVVNGGDTGQTSGGPTQQADLAGDANVQSLSDFVDQFGLQMQEVEIENNRLQPFVGPSRAALVEQGFAHPRSQIVPSAGGQATGGRFGGTAEQAQAIDGFEVVRAGIRARLVPRFEVRQPVFAGMVSNRFEQRLTRIPEFSEFATDVQVAVEDRTAVLTGTVATTEHRERIERMARMEPGISVINNQITVINQ